MKKSIFSFLLFILITITSFAQQGIGNGYFVKALNAIVLQGDTIKLVNPANGQIISRVNGKWTNSSPHYSIDSLVFRESNGYLRWYVNGIVSDSVLLTQNLQQVIDVGNAVLKSDTVSSDSTYVWRSDITQTTGSVTNRFYNSKYYSTYSGTQNQYTVGGIRTEVHNYGTGLVEWLGGNPTLIYTSPTSSTTNMHGSPVNIYNYGKFDKMAGNSSWLFNYNTDQNNNYAYGTVHTFNNYGILNNYVGFQLDAYNEGYIDHMQGFLAGLHHTSGTIRNMVGINLGHNFDSGHNWTGSPLNSWGIYIDRSIDRGSVSRHSILSESRSLNRLYGNFQLDTLRGANERIVSVSTTGLFSATKSDSIWVDAYNNKITSGLFSTNNGNLILYQQDAGIAATINLDGRYALIGSGGSGISNQLREGIVTDRNIDLTIADYTPANNDIIEVVVEDDIATGDSITLSINGGTAYTIFEYDKHDKDYILNLMYLDEQWYVKTRMGEEASVKGSVDATHTTFGDNGITLFNVSHSLIVDENVLVPKWYLDSLLSIPDYGGNVQNLSGTTPTLNTTIGKHGKITLSGNTTITLSNLVAGRSGNITIHCGGTQRTVQFAGYTIDVAPVLYPDGSEVVTIYANSRNVLSWYYDGDYVFINGTRY